MTGDDEATQGKDPKTRSSVHNDCVDAVEDFSCSSDCDREKPKSFSVRLNDECDCKDDHKACPSSHKPKSLSDVFFNGASLSISRSEHKKVTPRNSKLMISKASPYRSQSVRKLRIQELQEGNDEQEGRQGCSKTSPLKRSNSLNDSGNFSVDRAKLSPPYSPRSPSSRKLTLNLETSSSPSRSDSNRKRHFKRDGPILAAAKMGSEEVSQEVQNKDIVARHRRDLNSVDKKNSPIAGSRKSTRSSQVSGNNTRSARLPFSPSQERSNSVPQIQSDGEAYRFERPDKSHRSSRGERREHRTSHRSRSASKKHTSRLRNPAAAAATNTDQECRLSSSQRTTELAEDPARISSLSRGLITSSSQNNASGRRHRGHSDGRPPTTRHSSLKRNRSKKKSASEQDTISSHTWTRSLRRARLDASATRSDTEIMDTNCKATNDSSKTPDHVERHSSPRRSHSRTSKSSSFKSTPSTPNRPCPTSLSDSPNQCRMKTPHMSRLSLKRDSLDYTIRGSKLSENEEDKHVSRDVASRSKRVDDFELARAASKEDKKDSIQTRTADSQIAKLPPTDSEGGDLSQTIHKVKGFTNYLGNRLKKRFSTKSDVDTLESHIGEIPKPKLFSGEAGTEGGVTSKPHSAPSPLKDVFQDHDSAQFDTGFLAEFKAKPEAVQMGSETAEADPSMCTNGRNQNRDYSNKHESGKHPARHFDPFTTSMGATPGSTGNAKGNDTDTDDFSIKNTAVEKADGDSALLPTKFNLDDDDEDFLCEEFSERDGLTKNSKASGLKKLIPKNIKKRFNKVDIRNDPDKEYEAPKSELSASLHSNPIVPSPVPTNGSSQNQAPTIMRPGLTRMAMGSSFARRMKISSPTLTKKGHVQGAGSLSKKFSMMGDDLNESSSGLSFSMDLAVPVVRASETSKSPHRGGLLSLSSHVKVNRKLEKKAKQFQPLGEAGMSSFGATSPRQSMDDSDLGFIMNSFNKEEFLAFAGSKEHVRKEEKSLTACPSPAPDVESEGSKWSGALFPSELLTQDPVSKLDLLLSKSVSYQRSEVAEPSIAGIDTNKNAMGKLDDLLSRASCFEQSSLAEPSMCEDPRDVARSNCPGAARGVNKKALGSSDGNEHHRPPRPTFEQDSRRTLYHGGMHDSVQTQDEIIGQEFLQLNFDGHRSGTSLGVVEHDLQETTLLGN